MNDSIHAPFSQASLKRMRNMFWGLILTIANKLAGAMLVLAIAPASANVSAYRPSMPSRLSVKEIPLNFESGSTGAPITIYRHRGELAFVVIDSIAASNSYKISIGSIAQVDGKTQSLGAYLPLRNGEGVTVQLAKDSTFKLRAHVVLVSGYMNGRGQPARAGAV